ncbi:ubiquitin-associated domain-containing protein 2 [Grus japonensis]|uniref:Ubiquitin-associated domain-containing protein 2 n=1 Tax=Grus japonensis TaxID=30415 RepID=A0ABC9W559_GRUJA
MFTSTGSNGLYKAPLSKSLLLVPSAISILLTLLFQHYQKFFAYNLQAIKEDFQIWRLVCGRTICLDLKDTFCSGLLIYNFRIFERRYGSRKFSSFLLGAWTLSALFDLLLVEITQYIFGITINSLPSGFSKTFPAHASKVIAIKDYADDSCLKLFRNNVVQYNIQARTEIHEKGCKGCPGIVSCVFILQHQAGEANVEGYKADEYLSNQSNYNSYGSLLGLRLQFGSLATDKIVNND